MASDPRTTATAAASTLALVRRAATKFKDDQLTDRAAALTYYGLLAMFPALIAVVSFVGLVADPVATTDKLTEVLTRLGPESTAETFADPIRSITASRPGAGSGLILGLALALWAASSYVGAFGRASNVIYEQPERRPIWKLRPLHLLVTLAMVLLTTFVALALVLTGPVVKAVAEPFGASSTTITAWEVVKWPVVITIVLLIVCVLYFATSSVRPRGLRRVLPGAVVALVLWAVVSVGFAFYVANFGVYAKTYGTLAGIVVFLVWLFLTNVALLIGAEFNAERARRDRGRSSRSEDATAG